MACYFNQDYDLYGDSDKEILMLFKREKPPTAIALALEEINYLLATPFEGLCERFQDETGPWDLVLAEDDVSALEWLQLARDVLVTPTI